MTAPTPLFPHPWDAKEALHRGKEAFHAGEPEWPLPPDVAAGTLEADMFRNGHRIARAWAGLAAGVIP